MNGWILTDRIEIVPRQASLKWNWILRVRLVEVCCSKHENDLAQLLMLKIFKRYNFEHAHSFYSCFIVSRVHYTNKSRALWMMRPSECDCAQPLLTLLWKFMHNIISRSAYQKLQARTRLLFFYLVVVFSSLSFSVVLWLSFSFCILADKASSFRHTHFITNWSSVFPQHVVKTTNSHAPKNWALSTATCSSTPPIFVLQQYIESCTPRLYYLLLSRFQNIEIVAMRIFLTSLHTKRVRWSPVGIVLSSRSPHVHKFQSHN